MLSQPFSVGMNCKSHSHRSVAQILVLAAAAQCRWIIRALFRERASLSNTQEILTSLKINYDNTRASATQPSWTYSATHAFTWANSPAASIRSLQSNRSIKSVSVHCFTSWLCFCFFHCHVLSRDCPDPSLSWGSASLAVLHNYLRITCPLRLPVTHTDHAGSIRVFESLENP